MSTSALIGFFFHKLWDIVSFPRRSFAISLIEKSLFLNLIGILLYENKIANILGGKTD